MVHKVIVAKVDSVTEISGANNVQVAHVLGEEVIVSKSVKVGDIGLLFPADLQLSVEYARQNNLNRDSMLNADTTKKGYFDKNRKVRAQPFMKVKSTAYFADISSVAYTGVDVSTLVPGVQFNDLNGVEVAKRYVSEEAQRKRDNIANIKLKKVESVPLFLKHKDSEQLRHYIETIPAGALISFHAKAHGCFNYNARVKMWNGGVKLISAVVNGDIVVGVDNNGDLIPSRVINLWDNGNDRSTWVNLKFDKNEGVSGNKYYRITCTENHEFLTTGGWKPAKDLTPDDTVISTMPSYVPSGDQLSALIGMYLGDGYMSKSFNLQFVHKLDHEEYVDWKHSLFEGQHTDKVYKVSGYGSNTVFTMLRSSPYIRELFKDIQGVKTVTDWMVDKCTPLTLAIIYMDDGSLAHTIYQKDRIYLACCGIPNESIPNYIKMFTKFGITPTYYVDARGYNRIRFNRDEAVKLWELIKGYIPDVMKYKFPAGYQFGEPIVTEQGSYGHIKTTTRLQSSESFECRFKKYDIQTETGNYVVSNIVVHNSSMRVGMLPVEKNLPWWKQCVNKIIPVFPTNNVEMVVGTRNIIISNSDKVGHHGSEQFRFDVAESLRPHLTPGMTVYGEIYGHVNGKCIMPAHSVKSLKDKEFLKKYGDTVNYAYGCAAHEFKFFVYRITMVGMDGEVYEFPQKHLEQWCQEREIEHTLEIHPQVVYNGDVEWLKTITEELTERTDVLTEDYRSPSQISEGIILRVDHLGKTSFYKNKSYAHKVMEGICEVVDIEELS